MNVSLYFITGVMVGFEFIETEEESLAVLDLFILRLIFTKG